VPLFSEFCESPRKGKFVFDILAALAGVILGSPILIVIAGFVYMEDRRAPLFVQARVGRNGRLFNCFKFRTMYPDAEKQMAEWKDENHPLWQAYKRSGFKLEQDPRVTQVGKLLRHTSLDELPQLFNVLRGEMSLVGPRPLLEEEVAHYGEKAFEHFCRVRPGITGLWQISGRSALPFEARPALDMLYVERQSGWVDLWILLKTIRAVIVSQGAY
jgi:lipopolysaccharide/colanic/teichoic acid biosynthesis glycosyltransferase